MIQGHLAIASVPIQEWKTVYNPCEALSIGTIFPELNMPFFKTDSMGAGGQHSVLRDVQIYLQGQVRILKDSSKRR